MNKNKKISVFTRKIPHVTITVNIIYCANSIDSKWESRQYVSLAKRLHRVIFPATALWPGASYNFQEELSPAPATSSNSCNLHSLNLTSETFFVDQGI